MLTQIQNLIGFLTASMIWAASPVAAADPPAAAPPGYMLVIPQSAGAARFSTDLNQPPWNTATRLTGLLKMNTRRLADHPTWIYACYDRMALWLAYRCEGINGRSAKTEATERDGRVWWDDSVEFYCSPDGSRLDFFQFAANAAGVVYDGRKMDGEWNARWQVASAADEAGFTIAMRIPFSQLGTRLPRPGSRWQVNFSRHGPTSGHDSWVWCYNGLHDPRQYGELVFGGPAVKPVRLSTVKPWVMGENTVGLDAISGLNCSLMGRDRDGTPDWQGRAHHESGRLQFRLVDDHVRSVQASLEDADGRLLMRWWSDVQSPELTPRLADWSRRFQVLERVSSRLSAHRQAEVAAMTDQGRVSLKKAEQIAAEIPEYSAERWEQLETILDGLDRQLGDLSNYARTLEHFPKAEFSVGFESPMRKVMIRDFPFEGWFDKQVSVSLAANEHEAVQAVVMPFRRDLQSVKVRAEMPRPQHGSIECSVSLVGHVDVNDDPPYDSPYKGFWPDPLLSFLQAADIKAGEHVAFWMDVFADKQTPPGEYRGRVTVTAEGCSPIAIPLLVRVWGFELPDGSHLQNAFTYHEPPIRRFYGDAWNEDLARKYRDLILDHRLGIDHLYRREPPSLELIRYGFERGMNAFNVVFAGSGGAKERVIAALTGFIPLVRKAGLFNRAYVYGFDEIKAEKFQDAREVFDAVHRLCPGLRTMTTAQDPSFGKETRLREAVDIWVPLTPGYDLAEAEQLRREGRQMWWYICLVPTHPYANWFVEYPAIEPRLLTGAMSYKYRVDGFLYYLVNKWERSRRPIASGPRTEWDPASCVNSKGKWANGDGNLIYPGRDRPLSSIRLENIRDGLEDYEYLRLLAEGIHKVEALPPNPVRQKFLEAARPLVAVPDDVVRSTVEYTSDPQSVARWREQLAELIGNIRSACR